MTTIRPRRRWWRGLALTLGALLVAFLAFAIPRLGEELPPPATDRQSGRLANVTIFGATGRVGEGILTAALRDTAVTRIQVVTRRTSPTIERGLATGKVSSVTHDDYLDYGPLTAVLAETDVIYWAIGTSTLNVDSAGYARIHREFPKALLRQWAAVHGRDRRPTLHYISGAGADLAAWARWAREKARAEQELTALGEQLGVTVISYRPAGVAPV
ncbi:MAG: NmrA family NAD(P)-binding protein, partial [Gemmatimonadetes bacterium]|nr:NmrA family NAD(P)-binding protein [Gemmatimonadota bacterium]